jgi:hypothetical protein
MLLNENNVNKYNSTGIPKLIFDTAKHQSNVHDVGKKLNFYVQRAFTGLHDCIATRAVRPIVAPVEPGTTPNTEDNDDAEQASSDEQTSLPSGCSICRR